MENNNVNDELEIDLWEVFKNLLEHWKGILLTFSAAVLISVAVTVFLIPRQYEARISMYVNNSNKVSEGYIASGDIAASRNLVSTYMELIKSDCILEKVIEKSDYKKYGLEEPLSIAALRKMITCNQIKDTEIFEIKVRSLDPKFSAELAEKIGNVAPEEIARVFKAGSVEIVDRAKVPEKHVSPSVAKNAALGGLLGLMIACAAVVISGILNQKVKSPKDFENKYSVPLLGIIPDRMNE